MELKGQAPRDVGINGTRVQTIRKQRGLSQKQLAALVGTSNSQISMIEHGRSRTSLRSTMALAEALGTSMDHLAGRVEDARPTREIAAELKMNIARVRDLEEGRAEPLDPGWRDHVGIEEIDAAAGAGGGGGDGPVRGRLKFPSPWLRKHGLRPHLCRIIRVAGESMEPTVPDGCSILVDTAATELRHGGIHLIRTAEELVVRRAVHDPEAGWLLVSDNPDKAAWPTRAWPDGAQIAGEVRWMGRSFG